MVNLRLDVLLDAVNFHHAHRKRAVQDLPM